MKQYISGLLTGLIISLAGAGSSQLFTVVPTPPVSNIVSYQLTTTGSYALGLQFLSLTNENGVALFSVPTMIGAMTNSNCRFNFDFHNGLPNQTTNWNNIVTTVSVIALPN